MCLNCVTAPLLNRRQFLLKGLAATAAWSLAGCAPNPSPTPLGDFEAFPRQPIEIGSSPSFAAGIQSWEGNSITLSGPSLSKTFSVHPMAEKLDAAGQAVKVFAQLPDRTQQYLIWQDGDQSTVTRIRQLPSVGEPVEIPGGIMHPDMNFETADFGPLKMITRAGWGAAERRFVPHGESGLYDPNTNPNGWRIYDEPLQDAVHSAIIHHSALEPVQGPQLIQALHMQTANFADIGYHFVIDGLGLLYEARPFNVRGAHAGGFNTGHVGVCLLGNFEKMPPITAQLETLTQLLAYLKDRFTIRHIGGHRDFQPGVTVCPGQNLHPLLPSIAERLQLSYQQ